MGRFAAFFIIPTLAAVTFAADSGPKSTESVARVLERFDAVQASVVSLSAEFVETTRSPMLKNPIVARGHFFLTKPGSVMWEYTEPEAMRFVIARDEYVGVFPERKKAERRDIKRWSDHLFRFFGVGQGSAELGKFYDIEVEEPDTEMKGTHLLVLSPKKRRVRKSVDEVRLWVDATRLLPVRIDYEGKDGNSRSIRFEKTRLNPDLAAGVFDVRIPAEFKVSQGFSGLTGPLR